MTREKLKRLYHLAIAAALGAGFAFGYTLRDPSVGGTTATVRPVREYERDYPGCRSRYLSIKKEFARGGCVKADHRGVLKLLDDAITRDPGYLPYHALRARVYEDWLANTRAGRLGADDLRLVAQAVGLKPDAPAEQVAQACEGLAVETWGQMEKHPLIADVGRYGDLWQVIRQQHLNALNRVQVVQADVSPEGRVDLTMAFNCYAVTRDFDRYPNNVCPSPQGYSLEEKHMPGVRSCPQHPEVMFEFPCLAHIPVQAGRTLREDVEFFLMGMTVDDQKIDIDDVPAQHVHLLAFNVSEERRVVSSLVVVQFSDGTERTFPYRVPPWRQDEQMLRSVDARRELDAAYVDSEMHLCDGTEVESTGSPLYLYHVAIDLGQQRAVDKLYFRRHDKTTVGLEDEAIGTIRVLAIALE